MSKQISFTVYRYDELTEKARGNARYFIEGELYDREYCSMTQSLDDFMKNVFENELYRFDQLPRNARYQLDFYDDLGKYEGSMSGKSLIKLFRTFLENTYEKLTFSELDIQHFAGEANLWFYKDGSIFNRG